MTKSWDHGYVSDIEYIPGYYAEQSPGHLNAVCLASDVEPPVANGEPFTYCELGCGLGQTALVVAATSPQSRIWAFDFNPAHIAGARQMAKMTNLANVRFEENSFQELAEGRGPEDMPQFDYITMHGVWSWINRENRQYIVRFLAKYLKPGGVVYVSYNALPGRFDADPIRKMLFLLAQDELGPSDRRAVAAIKKAKELANIGAKYLPKEFLDAVPLSASYVSHEYLNEDWPLDYHIDVANDLANAKLSFVGDVNLLANFKSLFLTPEQMAILNTVSPRAVETITDYFLRRPFRRDVFIRGRRQLPAQLTSNRIEKCVLELCIPLERVSYQVGGTDGTVNLNKEPYEQIFNALAEGPKSIGELLKLPGVPEKKVSAREILSVLVGSKQVQLLLPEDARANMASIRHFNSVFFRSCVERGRGNAVLACSATAQAVPVGFVEMLAYEALALGAEHNVDSLAKTIWTILQNTNDKLVHDGKAFETEREMTDFIAPQLKSIIELSVPLWTRLGGL